jgi:hypothetical protein
MILWCSESIKGSQIHQTRENYWAFPLAVHYTRGQSRIENQSVGLVRSVAGASHSKLSQRWSLPCCLPLHSLLLTPCVTRTSGPPALSLLLALSSSPFRPPVTPWKSSRQLLTVACESGTSFPPDSRLPRSPPPRVKCEACEECFSPSLAPLSAPVMCPYIVAAMRGVS